VQQRAVVPASWLQTGMRGMGGLSLAGKFRDTADMLRLPGSTGPTGVICLWGVEVSLPNTLQALDSSLLLASYTSIILATLCFSALLFLSSCPLFNFFSYLTSRN
jgi:hypothetical protein